MLLELLLISQSEYSIVFSVNLQTYYNNRSAMPIPMGEGTGTVRNQIFQPSTELVVNSIMDIMHYTD